MVAAEWLEVRDVAVQDRAQRLLVQETDVIALVKRVDE